VKASGCLRREPAEGQSRGVLPRGNDPFNRQRAGREVTGRLLDALANPHVDVLAHPTSRLIGSREPLELDFERLVEGAVKASVALEINGSMYRLDLNDSMSRAAQQAGALLAIGSDAHSTAQLDQIRYGVFQARRGWIEARPVINTWPWAKFQRWLEKRSRGASHLGDRTR
jgi:DNA polymerase (family X)